MRQVDVAIIGAGPAGLFCALNVVKSNACVLLLEKNQTPGAKLRISGTGQCNLTHDGDIRSFFSRYGTHGKFLKPALLSFTNTDLIQFFTDMGLAMDTTPQGKVFPKNRSAKDVTDLLIQECQNRNVTIQCNEPVDGVTNTTEGFVVTTPAGKYLTKYVVVATGGVSYPQTGSTGDGYRIASTLGHTIEEIGPALSPLIIRDYPFSALAGMSFSELQYTIWRNNRKISQVSGDILFTHSGLSGPGILDHSRDIRAGDEIRLSFIGEKKYDEIDREIIDIISRFPHKTIKSIITDFGIPDRLSRLISDIEGIPWDSTGSHLSSVNRNRLVHRLTEFPLIVESIGDYSIAMVTRGGISLSEMNAKSMESKLVSGLYFIGEVLDVDGDTGGFNIQAAFSTGFLAADHIRLRIDQSHKG